MKTIFLKTLFLLTLILTTPLCAKEVIKNQALLNKASSNLFLLAEDIYGSLFAPANSATIFINGWRYRYYPATENYIGIKDDGDVYLLGKINNQLLENIGDINEVTDNILKQRGTKAKLIAAGDLSKCRQLPLGTVGKTVEAYRVDENHQNTELLGSLTILSKDEKQLDIRLIFDGKQEYKAAYQTKNIDGTIFTALNINSDQLLIPLKWCEGMVYTDPSLDYYMSVLTINDIVRLKDDTTRQSIKVRLDSVNSIYAWFDIFIWFDIETGYPLQLEAKSLQNGIALKTIPLIINTP